MLFILLLLMPVVQAKDDISLKMTHYNSSVVGLSCHYDYDGNMEDVSYIINKGSKPCLSCKSGECDQACDSMYHSKTGKDSKTVLFSLKLDGKCDETETIVCSIRTIHGRRIIHASQQEIRLIAQSDPPVISINNYRIVTESQRPVEIVCKVTNMCNKTKLEISSQEVDISQTETTYHDQEGRFTAIAKSNLEFSKAGNYTIYCKEAGKDDIYNRSYILEVRPIKKDPYHTKVTSSIPDKKQPMEFSDVTLRCEVTREGNPKEIIKYTWLKDGKDILGDIRRGQSITLRVTESDEGAYQCLIANSQNILTPLKDAEKFQLDVAPLGNPYHTKVTSSIPDQKQPMEFSDVTLRCEVTSEGNPKGIIKYTWLKDGEDILGDIRRGPSITLRVSESDEGAYQCLITNSQNILTPLKDAKEFQLDVAPLGDPYHTKVTSSIPDQKQLMEFANVTLSCEVTRKGTPKEINKYTWLKDGEDILGDIPGGPSITLWAVTDSHAGAYQCLITNSQNILTPLKDAEEFQLDFSPLGDPYHTRVNLLIRDEMQPMEFSSIPEQMQPMEFSDVTFSCEVTREGNPKQIKQYTWMKDGIEFSGGQNFTRRKITKKHAGSYKCLINNKRKLSTHPEDANELKLGVVPKRCQPQVNVNLICTDALGFWPWVTGVITVSWKMKLPLECQSRNPALKVHVHSKTEKESAWISQERLNLKWTDNFTVGFQEHSEICITNAASCGHGRYVGFLLINIMFSVVLYLLSLFFIILLPYLLLQKQEWLRKLMRSRWIRILLNFLRNRNCRFLSERKRLRSFMTFTTWFASGCIFGLLYWHFIGFRLLSWGCGFHIQSIW